MRLLTFFLPAVLAAATPQYGVIGHLYMQSNDSTANSLLYFNRAFDGTLTLAATVPTGGRGNGSPLGSEGSIVVNASNTYLFAVDAGSSQISVLALTESGPVARSRISSGGTTPISVTSFGNLVYVVNTGGGGNITGFSFSRGVLTPIPNSTLPLSSPSPGPAQISFSADGKVLIVTEKTTSLIDTYTVAGNGVPTGPITRPSHGPTPFGFALASGNHIVVSEAGTPGNSSASTYAVGDDGSLTLITGSVGTGQVATCWVAVSNDGEFAYATDFDSARISTFSLQSNGTMALAATTLVGNNPSDIALSPAADYLYMINTMDHTIGAFAVGRDRALTAITGVSGLPTGASGLIVQ